MVNDPKFYKGQRLSYDGALCTVHFHGSLPDSRGDWLGVEWDETTRGKHDGSYKGQKIFQCLSVSPTAASFIRPTRPADQPRSVLEAIRWKYGGESEDQPADNRTRADGNEDIKRPTEISGKVVEEIGFEKIKRQLAVLSNLRTVLLDDLVVGGITTRSKTAQQRREAQVELSETCPKIVELDVGWSVIEKWQDVVDICQPLSELSVLKTSGTRWRDYRLTAPLPAGCLHKIRELHLNETLIKPHHLMQLLDNSQKAGLQSLHTLSLSQNEWTGLELNVADARTTCKSVTTLLLEKNFFTTLEPLKILLEIFPNSNILSLQNNLIEAIGSPLIEKNKSEEWTLSRNLTTLNLSGNQIKNIAFVDSLPNLFPNLTSLRISQNPFYNQPSRISNTNARNFDSSYYLTLARISKLATLNYTTITPRDREDGEIYYIVEAETDIKSMLLESTPTTPEESIISQIKSRYPRYEELCRTYERENLLDSNHSIRINQNYKPTDQPEYPPGSLGARVVNTTLYISDTSSTTTKLNTYTRLLPKTISVYKLKSLTSEIFGLPPLQFKLVYESPELDPARDIAASQDWGVWGDWDVDVDANIEMPSPSSNTSNTSNKPISNKQDTTSSSSLPPPNPMNNDNNHSQIEEEGGKWVDGYFFHNGQKFKRREVEILDGMRPWGDFLEKDCREVRVRVEPF